MSAIPAMSISAQAAGDPGVASPPSSTQTRDQTAALADGHVSRAEYLAAFSDYRSCMSAARYTVVVLDSRSTVIDMRIPSEAVDRGVDRGGYSSRFSAVDDAWQIAHQDLLADGALLDSCLVAHGLAPRSDRQAKVDALLAAGVDLGTCLGAAGDGR